MIFIEKKNELYCNISGDKNILSEIYDHFSFQVPGYKFYPQYKYRTMGPGLFIFII